MNETLAEAHMRVVHSDGSECPDGCDWAPLLPPKCTYNECPRSVAEREIGCLLHHCLCGTHDYRNEQHECHP